MSVSSPESAVKVNKLSKAEVSEVSKSSSADNAGMTRFCFEVSEVGKP